MAINPIPNPASKVLNSDGTMTTEWYEYFKSRERVGLSLLPDVLLTALANGDAPVWDAAQKKWVNQPN